AACALGREESRGAHQRTDRPMTESGLDGLHAVVREGSPPSFELWR
ncbi:MAG: hypothetical protein E6G29_00285, partial [Actinobacteria bacterium]